MNNLNKNILQIKYFLVFLFLFKICYSTKIGILSDTHWDYWYQNGADADKMCRSGKGKAGEFGYSKCDTPLIMLQSIETFLYYEDIDVFFYLGDALPHKFPDTNQTALQLVKYFYSSLINLTNEKGIPFFWTLGNTDYEPDGQMPAQKNSFYYLFADLFQNKFSKDSLLSIQKGGYYTEKFGSNQRIISINSVMLMEEDQAINLTNQNPADMLTWLDQILSEAEINNEKVWILTHVPLGAKFQSKHFTYRDDFNELLVKIYQKYYKNIIAVISGHLHIDSFRLIYDTTHTQPLVVNFICPASTYYVMKSYPSYRVLNYNDSNEEISNWIQFVSDTEQDNSQGFVNFYNYYDTKTSYGINLLTPKTIHTLLNEMKENQDYFQSYWNNVHEGINYDCDSSCESLELCALEYCLYQEFEICRNSTF
ncbi:sphingomyelin phosphodiesterase [Anaeramoeba ignava]|uniref:Sphingomyelin phosphodiesterase n=1 Tax=Anaeramoeba ignava TaxID=1746090 RepID=A0A9Q0RHM0_ANAIG|nr:sphingomyelin phosphodiesterase [Anaeramoeba ignava]